MKIAFTGHRPDKLGGYALCPEHRKIKGHIHNFLKQMLEQYPELEVISGCALGIDQFAMEVAQSLGIPVTAAIPFDGFNERWPLASRRKLSMMLENCQEVHTICEPGYTAAKLQQRNQWMVDECDLLAAYWSGADGGTKNCIDYAKSRQCDLVVYDLEGVLV